jgi:hypothetical protein
MTGLTQPIDMYVPYDVAANQEAAYMYLTGDAVAFVEMNLSRSDQDIHLLMYANKIRMAAPASSTNVSIQPESAHILLKLLYILDNDNNTTSSAEYTYIESNQLSGYDNDTDSNITRAQVLLEVWIPLRYVHRTKRELMA